MSRPGSIDGQMTGPRVAVFTHDTYGLGHVRRCCRIVRELSERRPDASILLITGSPALAALDRLPPNADYVKIPTIVRTGAEADRPPHLQLPLADLTSLRQRTIRGALEGFHPDLLLVDNFPLGSREELRPVLEWLGTRSVPCVLGLRDIVDHPEVVRASWHKQGMHDVLDRLYERIVVYGHPGVLDAGEAYRLPERVRKKLRYCGYVCSSGTIAEPGSVDAVAGGPATDVLAEHGLTAPIVLATAGGGGDGLPLLAAAVEAAERIPQISLLAVTGPLMSAGAQEMLRRKVRPNARVVLHDFLPNLPRFMEAADVVIAMGGYNTMAELMTLRRRAIVVPRDWRYGEHAARRQGKTEWEQLLRAEAFERLGLVRIVRADALSPSVLTRAIVRELERGPRVRLDGDAYPGDGAARTVDEILKLTEGASIDVSA
ncbi:MAG: hypothetical protein OEQ13_14605 [Acidobacteriota bacterium]|nr:hypothetical protein [Acidobacteriota bacterium]